MGDTFYPTCLSSTGRARYLTETCWGAQTLTLDLFLLSEFIKKKSGLAALFGSLKVFYSRSLQFWHLVSSLMSRKHMIEHSWGGNHGNPGEVFCFVFIVPGIHLRSSCKQGKCSTTELHLVRRPLSDFVWLFGWFVGFWFFEVGNLGTICKGAQGLFLLCSGVILGSVLGDDIQRQSCLYKGKCLTWVWAYVLSNILFLCLFFRPDPVVLRTYLALCSGITPDRVLVDNTWCRGSNLGLLQAWQACYHSSLELIFLSHFQRVKIQFRGYSHKKKITVPRNDW